MPMSIAPASFAPTSSGNTVPREERRNNARYHLKLAITLRGDNNFYTGMTSDVSTGGVFVATIHILPIGTPVVLQFHLTRFGCDITVGGTVRWIREPQADEIGGKHVPDIKHGMGIQFEGLTPHDAKMIREFMQVRSPEFFD